MDKPVCKYCRQDKPDMVRVNDQHICYECAVARSDCRRTGTQERGEVRDGE